MCFHGHFVRKIRAKCSDVLLFSRPIVSTVYQIATVNPVKGGRARVGRRRREIAGGEKRDASESGQSGGSLIAASNDGNRGVCSSLEVSKNFKFSYSSRATPTWHRHSFSAVANPANVWWNSDESARIGIVVIRNENDNNFMRGKADKILREISLK